MKKMLLFLLVLVLSSCTGYRFVDPRAVNLSDEKIELYYSSSGVFFLRPRGTLSLDQALAHFVHRYPGVQIRDNINLYQDTKVLGYHLLCKQPLAQEVIKDIEKQ